MLIAYEIVNEVLKGEIEKDLIIEFLTETLMESPLSVRDKTSRWDLIPHLFTLV